MPAPRPTPPRALDPVERQLVLTTLDSERFLDQAPAQVHATLLDEGTYLCSPRTMYRLLDAAGEVQERRDQVRRPSLVCKASNHPQRVIRWHPLVGRNVAEHRVGLAHAQPSWNIRSQADAIARRFNCAAEAVNKPLRRVHELRHCLHATRFGETAFA